MNNTIDVNLLCQVLPISRRIPFVSPTRAPDYVVAPTPTADVQNDDTMNEDEQQPDDNPPLPPPPGPAADVELPVSPTELRFPPSSPQTSNGYDMPDLNTLKY